MLDELNQCVFVLQTEPNIAMHLWISMNGSFKKPTSPSRSPTLKRIADVINWLYTFQRKNDKDRATDGRERVRAGARD